MGKENILIQIDDSWYYRPMDDSNKEIYLGESFDEEEMAHKVVELFGEIDFKILEMYRTLKVVKGKLPWER